MYSKSASRQANGVRRGARSGPPRMVAKVGYKRPPKQSSNSYLPVQVASYKFASEAVLLTILGIGRVGRVAVDLDSAEGCVDLSQTSRRFNLRTSENDVMMDANFVTVLLAGPAACDVLGLKTKGLGDRREGILAVAAEACGGEFDEAKAFIDWLWARAANVVKRNWKAVEFVAQALMLTGNVSGNEVRRFIAGGC